MAKVSVIKIKDYSKLYDIIDNVINAVGSFNLQGKKVLLKPNCLMNSKNAITDPRIVGTVAKWVKNHGGSPQIGDSPMSGGKTAEDIYKRVKYGEKSGVEIISEIESGFEWVSFLEKSVLVSNEDHDFERLKTTAIAENVLDADFLINLPKWKTHFLTRFTGGVKNYWGIQVGRSKTHSHSYGDTANRFSSVVADLFSYVKKIEKDNLVIMDATTVMHGTGGPSFGNMKDLNLILASDNSVSLDSVAVSIGKMDPFQIPTLKYCHERGLGMADLNQIEIIGEELNEIQVDLIFPTSTIGDAAGFFSPLYNRTQKKIPRVRRSKCVKCGTCVRLCPTNSITLSRYSKYPRFNRKTCINCLCCAEGCPEHAIRAHKAGISGILGLV